MKSRPKTSVKKMVASAATSKGISSGKRDSPKEPPKPRTEKHDRMEKRAFSILLTLCGASLTVATVVLLLFLWEQSQVIKNARIQARRET